jgi:competence protein ComEA
MDRSDSPWRVLDSVAVAAPAAAAGSAAANSSGEAEAHPASERVPLRLIAGLLAAAALAVAAFGVAATGSTGGGVTVDSAAAIVAESARPSGGSAVPLDGDLVVDVQGAVLRPGVHHLGAGSRVADAIAAAGGYGPRVDAERAGRELNLAASLHDGDRVLVPSRDDPSGSGVGGSAGGSGGGSGGSGSNSTGGGGGSGGSGGSGGGSGALVDLNHATASELDALPGVGPVTAQKIIVAREEQPFATIEALRDRKVIGAAAFDKLKDLVTVTP